MDKKNHIVNEESLKKEAPLLAGIPKRNPFTVPEGYFDQLPSAIIDKIRAEGQKQESVGKKIFWLFRPQWIMAVFLGLMGIFLVVRHESNNPVSYEALAASVPDSTIYSHLQNNIEFVDENNLEDAVQNINFTAPAASDTTDQQQIINYLINHNVDASDIENAL
jgi:hypothetical protein